MAEEKLGLVKDYITKYNLEAEVSYAVNLALQAESDDPFRVIVEYLRTLQKHPEPKYDEEDEIIGEDEEVPALARRDRREQILATKFEVPDGWEPPVYDKEPKVAAWLKEVIASNRLMKQMAPSDREQLMHAFSPISFPAGSTIIKEGEQSDNMDFFVVESGVADISIEGKGSVMKATRGVAFGELALLHNAPRAATVTAEEAVTAYSLDMVSFKTILMGKSRQDAEDYVAFLRAIPTFSRLNESELATVGACLKEVEYPSNRVVVIEGEKGSSFYILRSGEVKCTQAGVEGEVSARLTRGDFFGELAMAESGDIRAATVTTTQRTVLLRMERPEFKRLLGPLTQTMAEQAGAQRSAAER